MNKPLKGPFAEPERFGMRIATGGDSVQPDWERPKWERIETLDCKLSVERHIVSDRDRTGFVPPSAREQLRLLKHRLQQIRAERASSPMRTLVVTSAAPLEGKTTVSANLALALAAGEGRVLLVDGDLRRRGLETVFETQGRPGLAECLADEIGFTDALCRIEPAKLYLLGSGRSGADPDLLQKPQLVRLFETAGGAFDWTIVDSPPLLPFADAHRLASIADGVLVVARAGVTRPSELERAIRSLDGMNVVGTVLNTYDEPGHRSYYDYYADRRQKETGAS